MSGSQQGKIWELATKFFLASYPVLMTGFASWGWWVSVHLVKIENTYIDQAELAAYAKEVDARFDELPPEEWTNRLVKVEDKIDKLFDEIVGLRVLVARIGPKPNHEFE